MASKKSKVLAIAFCAAVMAGIHVNPVFAAPYEEDVGYQSGNINGTELKDPNIEHPRGPHDDPADCGEDVEDTDLTIGDINKVVDDLVDNDKYMFLYHAASKEGKPAFRIVASRSYRNNQICTATPQPWKSCILFS